MCRRCIRLRADPRLPECEVRLRDRTAGVGGRGCETGGEEQLHGCEDEPFPEGIVAPEDALLRVGELGGLEQERQQPGEKPDAVEELGAGCG